MEALFSSCLIVGILYAVVSIIFGDWLSSAMDGAFDFLSGESHSWLEPTTLVGGITVFGGTGLLLTRYSDFGVAVIVASSLIIAVVVGAAVFFLYVRPMKQSENSIAFSMAGLSGALAEVIVPIPASGYGEVLVKVGAGFTNQIAASFEGVAITGGAKVVVVEVKDHTLYVSEVDFNY